jgi:HPt (histidine-containing phosphotransfer) domain-containing protein
MSDMNFNDLKKAGFNTEEGMTYTGSSEKYLAALQRFYKRADKTRDSINEGSANENYEEMTTIVHALKSNARTIGADTLASIAEQMERYGKSEEFYEMESLKDVLLDELGGVVECIRPYGEMEEVHPSSEISAEEAERIGNELIEAIEGFEDDKAINLIDELMRYPFRFTLINVLKNAREDIREFEYNEALLKIRRVISQIED